MQELIDSLPGIRECAGDAGTLIEHAESLFDAITSSVAEATYDIWWWSNCAVLPMAKVPTRISFYALKSITPGCCRITRASRLRRA
ncbi:hypothetical protein MJI20_29610, partial [Salmonella enterica subsp. enterica serovar Anatum]|nr:hypothetical protein [Salmonella enterica subsp. enterica serovar Anatum]